jgi:acyl phosphate:glycerol-3-phosphate acyltransferase
MLFAVLLVAAAYLIGSIPFSYLIVRAVMRQDIRMHGSGNVGATNVVRSAGKLSGIAALLLDILKGWGVVVLVRLVVASEFWPFSYSGEGAAYYQSGAFWVGLSALLAVLGHMFPVWLGFHGGKGVATATGVFLALAPLAIGIAVLVFFLVVALTRYVSLGSMLASASFPLLVRYVTGEPFWIVLFSIVIAFAVILKHHENIARLAGGKERKFPR